MTLAAVLALTAVLVVLGSVLTARHRRRGARTGRAAGPDGRPAGIDDFGLLRTVALVENLDAALVLRALLTGNGVPATVSTGRDGLVHVLVFPDAYDRARRMVGQAR